MRKSGIPRQFATSCESLGPVEMPNISKVLQQLHQGEVELATDLLVAPSGITPAEVMGGVQAFFRERPTTVSVRLIADVRPSSGAGRTGRWQAPVLLALERAQSGAAGTFAPGGIKWVTVTPESFLKAYARAKSDPTSIGIFGGDQLTLPGNPDYKWHSYRCPVCLRVVSVITFDGLAPPTCTNGHPETVMA